MNRTHRKYFTMDPPLLSLENNFQNGGSHMAEECYFNIGFCRYSISQESHVAKELTESVVDILLYSECTMGSP